MLSLCVFSSEPSLHLLSLHLKTSSGAPSQLSKASSQIHVKFPSPPAATLSSSHKRKERGKIKKRIFFMEWRRVKIKGLGLYFYSSGNLFPRLGKEQTCGLGRAAAGAQPAVDARLFSRLGLEREENISWKPAGLWTFSTHAK